MPIFVDCLITIGASEWPRLGYLKGDKGFSAANELVRNTLASALQIDASRVLDLFDSDLVAQDQYRSIKDFLLKVTTELQAPDDTWLRVITYFIGHGGMYGDNLREYCLPLRSTEEPYEGISSIRVRDLANTLASSAPRSLRVTVIDACFAGKALSAFQGQDQQLLDAAAEDALDASPSDWGNVLICASDDKSPAMLEPNGAGTKFTSAFSNAVQQGDMGYGEYLSLKDLVEITGRTLKMRAGAAVPQLHVPRQVSGSIDVPGTAFVRNSAFQGTQAKSASIGEYTTPISVQPELVARSSGNFVEYRGTVFDVADGNSFWNELAPNAAKHFVLLGRTNKNWIQKSPREAQRLAREFVRILKGDGRVTILSGPDEAVVAAHRNFFLKCFDPIFLAEHAVGVNAPLTYRIVESSSYGAVVADDRLILLPSLNSEQFRSEAIVLEFTRYESPQPFDNYVADLDRLIESSTPVELA